MNMISEQVKAQIEILRRLSFECHCQWKEELEFALSEAADTIESLSAKLADMERPNNHCEDSVFEKNHLRFR